MARAGCVDGGETTCLGKKRGRLDPDTNIHTPAIICQHFQPLLSVCLWRRCCVTVTFVKKTLGKHSHLPFDPGGAYAPNSKPERPPTSITAEWNGAVGEGKRPKFLHKSPKQITNMKCEQRHHAEIVTQAELVAGKSENEPIVRYHCNP